MSKRVTVLGDVLKFSPLSRKLIQYGPMPVSAIPLPGNVPRSTQPRAGNRKSVGGQFWKGWAFYFSPWDEVYTSGILRKLICLPVIRTQEELCWIRLVVNLAQYSVSQNCQRSCLGCSGLAHFSDWVPLWGTVFRRAMSAI